MTHAAKCLGKENLEVAVCGEIIIGESKKIVNVINSGGHAIDLDELARDEKSEDKNREGDKAKDEDEEMGENESDESSESEQEDDYGSEDDDGESDSSDDTDAIRLAMSHFGALHSTGLV